MALSEMRRSRHWPRGNEVNLSKNTDDPENHWVMNGVTLHYSPTGASGWNADPDQRTTFKYEQGRYDRNDRVFLGFGKITSPPRTDRKWRTSI